MTKDTLEKVIASYQETIRLLNEVIASQQQVIEADIQAFKRLAGKKGQTGVRGDSDKAP